VEPSYGTAIAAKGLDLCTDHQLFMMRHVEAVVRDNLADFLGVQEVANLLERWEQEADGKALVAAALPDETARTRLGRVLRALVAEQVSIAAWREILKAIEQVGLPHDDVYEAVQTARLYLKPYLPGNDPHTQLAWVPESVERAIQPWLHTQDGKYFFALPPAVAQEIGNEMRQALQPLGQDVVLVTRTAWVRHFLRRLIGLEYPRVWVIARDELVPEKLDLFDAPEER
jgi:flagellar biosynthesis component FlhA